MPLFYVKIRKNIDICNYLPIYYPAICRGWGTFSVPSVWVMLTPFLFNDCMIFCFLFVIYSIGKATAGKAEPRTTHKTPAGRPGAGNRRHEIQDMPLPP